MTSYVVEEKYRFYTLSSSKGTQIKYKKGDYYYKLNKVGNEGLVEYLVSLILQCSSVKYPFAQYEYCTVNRVLGCRSSDFLQDDEIFTSCNTLFTYVTGKPELSEHLATLRSSSDRLQLLLEIFEHFNISRKTAVHYLNTIMQLDMLIENTDRHGGNYGIVFNHKNSTVRVAPIFDNGRALRTDKVEGCAATISGSFFEQVTTFSFPVKPCFTIDYDKLFLMLNSLDNTIKNTLEYKFLLQQLNEYEYLFNKSTTVNITAF